MLLTGKFGLTVSERYDWEVRSNATLECCDREVRNGRSRLRAVTGKCWLTRWGTSAMTGKFGKASTGARGVTGKCGNISVWGGNDRKVPRANRK